MHLMVMEVEDKNSGQLRVTLDSLYSLTEIKTTHLLEIQNRCRGGCQLLGVQRFKSVYSSTLSLLSPRSLASLATVTTALSRHFIFYS